MASEFARTRAARIESESALVRIVHNYGSRPEFVLMGGLMPDILCGRSTAQHAGTTDVDVQVNLEIASSTVNGKRLELALHKSGFEPEGSTAWRWRATGNDSTAIIKFELLADLSDAPNRTPVKFDNCEALSAVNLRGTGFASRDVIEHELTGPVNGNIEKVKLYVTGVAGYLLSKVAAARQRRLEKDWYDIAFVLIHNDVGGPAEAAALVRSRFAKDLVGEVRTSLEDLFANFESVNAQGPQSYCSQMSVDHPGENPQSLLTDAVIAVDIFRTNLFL